MSAPWYDTEEGIKGAVSRGLDGVHQLCDERHRAGYDRGERMTDWVVCSHFYLDSCGNAMIITENAPDYYTFEAYPPQVFSMDYYRENAKSNRGFTSTIKRFPSAGETCPQCLEGWDLQNVANYYFNSYGDKVGYHKDCHDLLAAEEEKEWFKELLDSAVHYTKIVPIPNGYGRRNPRPWFMVYTPLGPIRIGWRKRVISIHWDKADGLKDIDGKVLFADQSVTKDRFLVHAWGKENAIEYLKRLLPILEQAANA